MTYRGRFAPSPTGPLHFGSLVSALASWLDARAHGGAWLVRIEDIDGPRTVAGAAEDILATLERFGMHADEPPVWQSRRLARYQEALDQLKAAGLIYPCGCTRKEIADSLLHEHARNTTLAYPGTCRDGLHGRPARAWRLRLPDHRDDGASVIAFDDRWQGRYRQDLALEVGDFALKRADGLWAYQLAVVVDDAASGITDVVRGADVLDSTPRQSYLQRCLHFPPPRYLHVPVLNDAKSGEKLSKQNGAQALPREPAARMHALREAARFLDLGTEPVMTAGDENTLLRAATDAWRRRHVSASDVRR
ncbi:MAG: glutamyl-Q tRNA(Asp) synthetase [Paraburkholderia sp.]|nr:glutamyl-Q tRNA(Asp) synthetase [Paraburkholderia sp.]